MMRNNTFYEFHTSSIFILYLRKLREYHLNLRHPVARNTISQAAQKRFIIFLRLVDLLNLERFRSARNSCWS